MYPVTDLELSDFSSLVLKSFLFLLNLLQLLMCLSLSPVKLLLELCYVGGRVMTQGRFSEIHLFRMTYIKLQGHLPKTSSKGAMPGRPEVFPKRQTGEGPGFCPIGQESPLLSFLTYPSVCG